MDSMISMENIVMFIEDISILNGFIEVNYVEFFFGEWLMIGLELLVNFFYEFSMWSIF